jgi:hypothetical protein
LKSDPLSSYNSYHFYQISLLLLLTIILYLLNPKIYPPNNSIFSIPITKPLLSQKSLLMPTPNDESISKMHSHILNLPLSINLPINPPISDEYHQYYSIHTPSPQHPSYTTSTQNSESSIPNQSYSTPPHSYVPN